MYGAGPVRSRNDDEAFIRAVGLDSALMKIADKGTKTRALNRAGGKLIGREDTPA